MTFPFRVFTVPVTTSSFHEEFLQIIFPLFVLHVCEFAYNFCATLDSVVDENASIRMKISPPSQNLEVHVVSFPCVQTSQFNKSIATISLRFEDVTFDKSQSSDATKKSALATFLPLFSSAFVSSILDRFIRPLSWSHVVFFSTCLPSPPLIVYGFHPSCIFVTDDVLPCCGSILQVLFYVSHYPDHRPVHHEFDSVEFARIDSKSIMSLMTRTGLVSVNQDMKTLHQVACEETLFF